MAVRLAFASSRDLGTKPGFRSAIGLAKRVERRKSYDEGLADLTQLLLYRIRSRTRGDAGLAAWGASVTSGQGQS